MNSGTTLGNLSFTVQEKSACHSMNQNHQSKLIRIQKAHSINPRRRTRCHRSTPTRNRGTSSKSCPQSRPRIYITSICFGCSAVLCLKRSRSQTNIWLPILLGPRIPSETAKQQRRVVSTSHSWCHAQDPYTTLWSGTGLCDGRSHQMIS